MQLGIDDYKKLVVGISQTSDVEKLLKIGYRQFYFGYLPEEFFSSYGSQVSLNRRYYLEEQFTDLEETFSVIEKVHSYDGKIYLALNPMQMNNIIFKYSKKVFEIFKEKVDGVIVSNISLLKYLKNIGYENISLSNLFGFYNIPAVNFFKKRFNPKRVILPRDVSVAYIKSVVETFPDIEIEIFLFGDNCMFSESFCFAEHGYKEFAEPLCKYSTENMKPIKKPIPDFKEIVLNKKDFSILSTQYLDVDTLLNKLMYMVVHNLDFTPILETLDRYDPKYLSKYYEKLIFVLSVINTDLAKQILSKLEKVEKDTYSQFHKNNQEAILRIFDIFRGYDNIYFKIPARGRNFEIKRDSYSYEESQYRL